MNIENLRCFLILAQELNFTRAARKAHITQAAMSRRISGIESELNVRLLDRDRHTVALTPTGRELFELLLPILEDYENAVSRIQNVSHGVFDLLRVGIGLYEHQLLFPVMQVFLKQSPIPQIHFVQLKYKELIEEFNHDHLDLVVSSDQYFDLLTVNKLDKFLIHNQPWDLAINRDNPLAQNNSVSLSSLNTQNIITMNKSSLGVLKDLYRGRFLPLSADYVNSHETKLLLINANRGVGFIPKFVDTSSYPQIVTRIITPYYRPRCFYVVIRKDHPSQYAHKLAHMLRDYYSPLLWMKELPR